MPNWSEIEARPANYWQSQSGPATGPDVTALLAALLAAPAAPIAIYPGSAASPGLTVQGDPNTGLYAPAADQMAMATNGVRRWLLSNTALQIDVPITGTAVTQTPSDATAGRLVRVGDYGWGQSGNTRANELLNTLTTGGVYQYGPPGTGETNGPTSNGGSVLVIRYSSNWITQIAFGANDTQLYYRRTQDNGATWSAWVRGVHQGNLLGAVSQSAGVPTGALFETGSNANGRYERRADGYMECFHSLTASAAAATSWTFPSAFAEPPVVSITPIATVASSPALDAAPTTTAASFSCRDKTDARRADVVHLRAIGRWSTMA